MTVDTTIPTERLELRLLAEADTEAVFRYASDPEVAKNTAWFPHRTIEDTADFVRFVLSSHSSTEGNLGSLGRAG